MKRSKVIIPIVLGICIVGVLTTAALISKFAPSKQHMELSKYFGIKGNQVKVILEDTICEQSALFQEKEIYVDFDFVKEKLNNRFYWDKNENQLIYTTSTAIITTEPGSKECYQNNSKITKEYELVKTEGEKVYVALDYVKEYTALEYKTYKKPNRVVINNVFGKAIDYVKTDTDCALRNEPDIKSPILADLKTEESVRIIEAENKETGFCKVMAKSGVIGYVKAKELGKTYKKQYTTQFKEEVYSHFLKENKVNLVWHQVTSQAANAELLTLLNNTKGVNVVSPTWFATSDNEGGIDSLASDNYVMQAHRAGVEVWGLCNDFSPHMKIGTVLGSTSKRQKLAKNLVAEAIRYSLDGINIDFENVRKESGEDFVQFVRELGILCRNNGIVLSIDNYPLASYNEYYNRKEQAAVADYVITMAYDEYYAGSKEAGPVSSISYVEKSTENVLKQVPANQAIIALPFYSRHWVERTKGGKVKLTSETCSMSYAQEILSDAKTQAVWDDKTQMNYLEYKKDNALHKMWIEDRESLECKMKAATKEKNIAGVAFWKMGLEKREVWDMVIKYLK